MADEQLTAHRAALLLNKEKMVDSLASLLPQLRDDTENCLHWKMIEQLLPNLLQIQAFPPSDPEMTGAPLWTERPHTTETATFSPNWPRALYQWTKDQHGPSSATNSEFDYSLRSGAELVATEACVEAMVDHFTSGQVLGHIATGPMGLVHSVFHGKNRMVQTRMLEFLRASGKLSTAEVDEASLDPLAASGRQSLGLAAIPDADAPQMVTKISKPRPDQSVAVMANHLWDVHGLPGPPATSPFISDVAGRLGLRTPRNTKPGFILSHMLYEALKGIQEVENALMDGIMQAIADQVVQGYVKRVARVASRETIAEFFFGHTQNTMPLDGRVLQAAVSRRLVNRAPAPALPPGLVDIVRVKVAQAVCTLSGELDCGGMQEVYWAVAQGAAEGAFQGFFGLDRDLIRALFNKGLAEWNRLAARLLSGPYIELVAIQEGDSISSCAVSSSDCSDPFVGPASEFCLICKRWDFPPDDLILYEDYELT